VITGARAASAVEVDTEGRESSTGLCGDQPAHLVRGSSATNHCHAAPALLTREYQSDDRRCSLTSAALPALAPLDKNFHIRPKIETRGPTGQSLGERVWGRGTEMRWRAPTRGLAPACPARHGPRERNRTASRRRTESRRDPVGRVHGVSLQIAGRLKVMRRPPQCYERS